MAKQRPRKNGTRDESLIAFRLYCALPFGKLNHKNPDIIQLADKLGRTPSSVSMKACNFARLDPLHQARGIAGLAHGAKLEETIWQQFHADSEAISNEAEAAYEQLALGSIQEQSGRPNEADPRLELPEDFRGPEGPTEIERTIKTRRVQGFFRRAVLTSYGHRCCLTGLAVPELLNASHIIPWSTPGSEQHRADPSNGLCLNALHDRAFDRGLISFYTDHRLLVSPRLAGDAVSGGLGRFAGAFKKEMPLILPDRFAPSVEALAYHRENIFHAA